MKQKQVFNNAKWIIGCKIVQSLMQLAIGMISARYLGPSNYGLINYAASVVAFALPLMKLGFDAILVHELVESPKDEGEIMGTALAFNVGSGLLCMAGVSAFAILDNFGQTETILVCILYSVSIFFAALEMVQYWFQYKLLSKYSSLVMLGAYLFVSAYKIFLLATGKSVYWFAISHSVEYSVIAFSLLMFYGKKGGQVFRFSLVRAKKMLAKSKHYILAALMIMIIQNTDHIMVTNMIGTSENGLYSAAITCVSMFQFVYVAIVDSFRPYILTQKKESHNDYGKTISQVYGLTGYMALAQTVVFVLFAPFIIQVLYGPDFAGAVPVMQILAGYFFFSLLGLVRNVWILAEEKQRYLWIINLSGALANIVLNAVLISLWGACGAALASLITQCFANFILGFIMKPIRQNNRLLLKGMNPRFFIKEMKSIVRLLLKKG